MKKMIMIFILVFSFAVVKGQIRLNVGTGGTVSSTSAFLDASSYSTWNNSTSNGKGLVFPQVDLTTFNEIMAPVSGIPSSFPTRFDGMLVYNSTSGTAAIGATAVIPGFYYYKNTSSSLNGGTWVRLDGSDTAQDVYYGILSTTSPDQTDIQALSSAALSSGNYSGTISIASTDSEGYFTVAIPVSWRNPLLTIGGDDTWNIILPLLKITINNVEYQVWQTDVEIPSGRTLAIR